MENIYTLKEFADSFTPAYSRQGILHLVKNGTLPGKTQGRGFVIDVSHALVKEFIKNSNRTFTKKPVKVTEQKPPVLKKSVKVKGKKTAKKENLVKVAKPKKEKKPEPVALVVEDNPNDDEVPQDIYDRLDSGETLSNSEIIKLPKGWVDKIKVYEQTKQIVQKREQERKELINKKLIRITLGKLFEIHVNEFLTIRSKIVPDLAGIFESTDSAKMIEAEKAIDEELWRVLKHIKIEFNKFLERQNSEPISE